MSVRDVFRPIGSSAVIWSDDWRCILQATPDTVPTANQTSGIGAYSNKEADYTSTTSGKKFIVHYEEPFEMDGVTYPIVYFGEPYTSGSFKVRYTPIGSPGTSSNMSMTLRIRAITEEFDPAEITWNNHETSLTINASVIHSSLIVVGLIPAGTSGSSEAYTGVYNIAAHRLNSNVLTVPIYGVIADVMPTITWPASYSARYAQYALKVNTSEAMRPYVYTPEVYV